MQLQKYKWLIFVQTEACGWLMLVGGTAPGFHHSIVSEPNTGPWIVELGPLNQTKGRRKELCQLGYDSISLYCSCVTKTYGSTKPPWAKVGQTPMGWINSRHDDCVVFRPNDCPLANKSTPPVATGQATEWRWPSEDGNSPEGAGLKKTDRAQHGIPPMPSFFKGGYLQLLGTVSWQPSKRGLPSSGHAIPSAIELPGFHRPQVILKAGKREGFCRWHWANYDIFIYFWSLHFWKASKKTLEMFLRFLRSPPRDVTEMFIKPKLGRLNLGCSLQQSPVGLSLGMLKTWVLWSFQVHQYHQCQPGSCQQEDLQKCIVHLVQRPLVEQCGYLLGPYPAMETTGWSKLSLIEIIIKKKRPWSLNVT